MYKLLILLLVSFTFLSCGGKSAEDQLQGTWNLSDETVDAMAAELGAMATDELKDMMRKLTVTFGEDGKIERTSPNPMTGQMEAQKGTYSVTKTDGTKVTTEIQFEGEDEKETTVIEIDGDTISFESEGKTMKFNRK